MMATTIKLTLPGGERLEREFAKIADELKTPELLQRVARSLRTSILIRTAAGKDVLGRNFVGYSEKYKLKRLEAGRPVQWADLFFKGHMLGAMNIGTESPNKVKIFFNDAQQAAKAHGHTTGWNRRNLKKRRRFFEVSATEVDDAIDDLNSYLDELLRET